MPGTGVYFVNSASSALCAALLIASGVPKSGSPAPKSITSTPDRRSLSTAAPTAIVADVAILEVRSANRAIALRLQSVRRVRLQPDQIVRLKADTTCELCPHRLLLSQPLLDQLGHQPVHLPAEREHFLDQPRADERILRGRHHEHSLEGAGELAVHQRHLHFVLEVGDRAQTPHDDIRLTTGDV